MNGKIRAVIFDYGGVISMPQQHDVIYDWAASHANLSESEILAGYRNHRVGFDRGDYSGEEMYRMIYRDLGKPCDDATLVELTRRDMESWGVPNPETYAWAKELKSAGYLVGILTNMPLTFIPWFNRAAADFRALADAEVISAQVRLAKPYPEIYQLMIQRLNVNGHECIFFDDLPQNVDGARAAGMNSEVFTSVAAAKTELAKYEGR